MNKNYENYSIEETASIISREIIFDGKSQGWSGSIEKLEQLQEFLKPFNIHYVCDMKGIWKNIH